MRIETQRFGNIILDQDQLFLFPAGLIGMETLRDWALLPDLQNPSVAWLQSATRGDRALPLISPRAFFPDYRVQVSRRELASLHMKPGAELYVLTTIAGHAGKLSTNLRSPVVINLSRRLGCQVISEAELPLQHPVPTPDAARLAETLLAPTPAAAATPASAATWMQQPRRAA